MANFEVGIVGAGIHGAAAAYHLASRGVGTLLLERGSPAGGPTGRSSAICRAYYTNRFLARMARDSIRMFQEMERLTGVDAQFRRTGLLFLHPPEDAEPVRRTAAALDAIGIGGDVLTPTEVAHRFPTIDIDGIGIGAWERDAGYADPVGATLGLCRKAQDLGCETRFGTAVDDLRALDGGWTLALSDGTRVDCDRVLLAAGPWTRSLARQAGVDLPLTVERHVVAVFGWGDAEPVPPHADVEGGYYLRPEAVDQFLVGSLHAAPEVPPDDFAEHVADREVLELASKVTARSPQLEGAEPQGGWASLYDVSPDWQPMIGRIAPGLFVDAGTSGHGFKLAPALGAQVAEMVLDGDPDPALADFDPFRFEGGRPLPAGYRDSRILG
jgi:sarcosine oxidase, subunit beta